MKYSTEVKEYLNSKFNKSLELFGYKKKYILSKLSLCYEDEEFLMKYLYASMPLSDISNYDFDLFHKYVKHGIFLRENTPWGTKIPEDIFLNYVIHYRVNNEAIEDCRDSFYQMLKDRVADKSMYEAALEVNYWCAEKATYKSTDERTASPLTVLKCGYGRCGEESTLAVTALRSVGIPARQIYTPRWAHCDDNHAWVEVWCDGKWHYLGACEPEPVLDKGWFTSAASRAMVIHSRIFSNYSKSEEIISQNEVLTTISNIKKYLHIEKTKSNTHIEKNKLDKPVENDEFDATIEHSKVDTHIKKLKLNVVDSQNKPIKDAEIRVEILNYSEMATVAKLVSDRQGQAFICLGLGTASFHVVKDGKFLNKILDIKDVEIIEFNMDEAVSYEEEMLGQDIDIIPPKDKKILPYGITKEEQAVHDQRVKHCNSVREESINKIFKNIEESKAQLISDKALVKLKNEPGIVENGGEAVGIEDLSSLKDGYASFEDKRSKELYKLNYGHATPENCGQELEINKLNQLSCGQELEINELTQLSCGHIAPENKEQPLANNRKKTNIYMDIDDILFKSSGNYNEILDFLKATTSCEDLEKRVNLLKTLSHKDYVDSKSHILNSHINHVVSFNEDYYEEIYLKYVLCPRIYLEKITAFRERIDNYFSQDLKKRFKAEPALIWSYINENVKEFPQHEYEELFTVPLETLKMGSGSLISKKILFVAICRTLGIPARINPSDLSIEYYKYSNLISLNDMNEMEKSFECRQVCNNTLLGIDKDMGGKKLKTGDKHENQSNPSPRGKCRGDFVKVENINIIGNSMLTVSNVSDSELKYYQNWTIAVLEKGLYKTLSLQDNIPVQGKANIRLVPGHYRILTSNRLPNGSIFARKYLVSVSDKENKEVEIAKYLIC